MVAIRKPAVDPSLFRSARSGVGQARSRHPIAAWCGLLALRGVALLPFPVIYRLAGILGRVAGELPVRPVRFATITIQTCFPGLSPAERRDLARRSLVESARSVCELGAFWTWTQDRVLGLVQDVRGAAVVQAAAAQARGVILVGPHLGAWELVGLYCSSRFRFTALYKPPAATTLERFTTRGRTRFGARLAPATPGGLRTLVRDLSDGGIVGIMPDQDPRRGAGVFVPFFGVLANTTTLVSRLAGLSGARVVLAFAERLPAGAGFRLHFREASPAVYDADMLTSAAALNLDIERLVRDCPEQYLWSYKRFRVRPHGEQNPYRPLAHAETTTR